METRKLETQQGVLELVPCCDSGRINTLSMDPDLRIFRPPDRQHQALVKIAASEDGCVSIARSENQLVAYAAFHRPDSFERMGTDTTGGIYELGAVEVTPARRSGHLARRLLELTFETGLFEDRVVIATLYYWHYDLEGSGLSIYRYRNLLERLYASVGFSVFTTDDPEIRGYPENALMARIGASAPQEVVQSFHNLRFTEKGMPMSGSPGQ